MEEPRKNWLKELFWEIKWILAWVFLFAVVGIIVQSLRAGQFVFIDFFWANYNVWLASFGNFSSLIQITSYPELFGNMINDWYYFLYTGGLLSLIWGILSFIFRKLNRKRIESKRQRTFDEITEDFEQRKN
jgi:hypothetical protein